MFKFIKNFQNLLTKDMIFCSDFVNNIEINIIEQIFLYNCK